MTSPIMPKDYYATLGVSKEASEDEIKKAYRRLAHKHHPDKGGDAAKFKDASEAYEVLSDKQKRETYDRFGSAAFEQGAPGAGGPGFGGFGGFPGGGFGNVNVEDFGDLGDVLGEMFGFGGTRSRRERRGRDLEVAVELSFKDAAFGTKQEIRLYKQDVCSHCKGTGGEPDAKMNTCSECQGRGQVTQAQRTMFGTFQSAVTCPSCHGRGKKPDKVCTRCQGNSVERKEETLAVEIPPGMETGSVLKVPGKGEAPAGGGVQGDLYVKVRVKPDSFFNREGHNVHSQVTIPFSILALGGDIKVPTLDGDETLKVASGTPAGTHITIKGKGIPYLRSKGRGDHVVQVDADVPKKLSKEQKTLLEKLHDTGI